ncbi:MAG: hypothetical protein ABJA66_01805 [Actinomycetota bacterium]
MSSTRKEMQEKRELYFEKGANEVWDCNEYGEMMFFDEKGELKQSKKFPDFPKKNSIGEEN